MRRVQDLLVAPESGAAGSTESVSIARRRPCPDAKEIFSQRVTLSPAISQWNEAEKPYLSDVRRSLRLPVQSALRQCRMNRLWAVPGEDDRFRCWRG